MADPKDVTARLGGRGGILQPAKRPPYLDGLVLEDEEEQLLDLVDGSRTLYELCEAGPLNPGINARILYALLAIRLIGPDKSSGAIRIQVRDLLSSCRFTNTSVFCVAIGSSGFNERPPIPSRSARTAGVRFAGFWEPPPSSSREAAGM